MPSNNSTLGVHTLVVLAEISQWFALARVWSVSTDGDNSLSCLWSTGENTHAYKLHYEAVRRGHIRSQNTMEGLLDPML